MAQHLDSQDALVGLVPSEGLQAEDIVPRRYVFITCSVSSLGINHLFPVIPFEDVGIYVLLSGALVQKGETY